MERKYKNMRIRSATTEDAEQLCRWWNDGAVMEHAGFPNGLGKRVDEVAAQIREADEKSPQIHILLLDDIPIGELHYRSAGAGICGIGIKICEVSCQNKGLGKIVLSLFIDGLFHEYGFQKITLDTNLKNTRAQHVYEQLGFQKIRTTIDSWKDQLGKLQSSVDYELTEKQFVSYLA